MKKKHDVIIIGSGLSGLSTAHFIHKYQPELEILILDKENRPGGAIETFHEQGFQAEWGPHGFLDNTPESRELLADLGLDTLAQRAPLGDFLRYVCHHGKLEALPQNPKKLLTTPLLSLGDKLRILFDFWKKPLPSGQSVSQWAAYRFGKGVLPLVDAAVTGTFAGDPDRLCIDSVMPGVRRLEFEHGSVLKGLKAKKKRDASSGPLPSMLNFSEGMEYIISTLTKNKNVRFNSAAVGISHENGIWMVETADQSLAAKTLVLALPVNEAVKLLAPLSTPPVSGLPVARILNIVMGFGETAHVPYGFGYLAPERENRFCLGAMFTSHMFPNRSPKGSFLLEALIGGRRHPERLDIKDDDELIHLAYEDLKQLIDLPEAPWFSKVLRPKHGIPQLESDHPKLTAWRYNIEKEFSRIYICGFGWDGIGMNEMIKSAKKVAHALVAGVMQGEQELPAVKPVYF